MTLFRSQPSLANMVATKKCLPSEHGVEAKFVDHSGRFKHKYCNDLMQQHDTETL